MQLRVHQCSVCRKISVHGKISANMGHRFVQYPISLMCGNQQDYVAINKIMRLVELQSLLVEVDLSAHNVMHLMLS